MANHGLEVICMGAGGQKFLSSYAGWLGWRSGSRLYPSSAESTRSMVSFCSKKGLGQLEIAEGTCYVVVRIWRMSQFKHLIQMSPCLRVGTGLEKRRSVLATRGKSGRRPKSHGIIDWHGNEAVRASKVNKTPESAIQVLKQISITLEFGL